MLRGTVLSAVCLAAVVALGGGCALKPSAPLPAAETGAMTQVPASALEGFVQPAEGLHAGGRIHATDLPALSAANVRHVIDLTPDEETPDFDEAAAVRAAGLRYDNLPISGPDDLTVANVIAFDRLLEGREGTTLVHCASGNRVGALAALRAAWLHGADDQSAVEEGRRWGLRGLEGEVRKRLDRQRCLALAADADAQARCGTGS